MENRIKQQLDVFADRTSAATMRANQLRLYWGTVRGGAAEAAAAVRAGGDGAGEGAVRDDPGAAAEGGCRCAGERKEDLG